MGMAVLRGRIMRTHRTGHEGAVGHDVPRHVVTRHVVTRRGVKSCQENAGRQLILCHAASREGQQSNPKCKSKAAKPLEAHGNTPAAIIRHRR